MPLFHTLEGATTSVGNLVLERSISKLKELRFGKVQKISLKGNFPLLTTFWFIPEEPVTNEKEIEKVLMQTFGEEGKKLSTTTLMIHSPHQRRRSSLCFIRSSNNKGDKKSPTLLSNIQEVGA